MLSPCARPLVAPESGNFFAVHRDDGLPSYELSQDRGGGFNEVLTVGQGVVSDLIGAASAEQLDYFNARSIRASLVR